MVLLLGQTFGLAAEDVRPTLDEPTYQTVLRETVESECQLVGDPDDWPSRARKGWRQLILAHLEAAGPDASGDRFFARAVRMHSLTSEVDRKIAEGDLAARMQLGIAKPIRAPGFCVALSSMGHGFQNRRFRFFNLIWGSIKMEPFAEDLRQRIDLPVFGAVKVHFKLRLSLTRRAFLGRLGLVWRNGIRDVRIRLLNQPPAESGMNSVYEALSPVVDLGWHAPRDHECCCRASSNFASLLRSDSLLLWIPVVLNVLRWWSISLSSVQKWTLTKVVDCSSSLSRASDSNSRVVDVGFAGILEREVLWIQAVWLSTNDFVPAQPARLRPVARRVVHLWRVFPQDRERLEAVLRAALAAATDPVLGDDSVRWIESFLERSEALYPKGLESDLSEVPWLSQTHGALQEQLQSTRDRWWNAVLQGEGDRVDLEPFEVLRLIEALLEADQRLPHRHCVPQSLLKELRLLQEELPTTMLKS